MFWNKKTKVDDPPSYDSLTDDKNGEKIIKWKRTLEQSKMKEQEMNEIEMGKLMLLIEKTIDEKVSSGCGTIKFGIFYEHVMEWTLDESYRLIDTHEFPQNFLIWIYDIGHEILKERIFEKFRVHTLMEKKLSTRTWQHVEYVTFVIDLDIDFDLGKQINLKK